MPSSLTISDFTSDANNEELTRLVKLYEFPPFVKKASMDELKRPPQGAVTTFADPVHRKFPCHSAAATWLNAVYFHEKSAEYHPNERARVQQRLEHYVDYFRIRPAYEQLVKRAAELKQGESLPDSAYAYVWVDDNGTKERHLPLRSAMETKAAGEWLSRYRDRLPYHDRHVVAAKILEKAAQYSAGLDSDLTEFLEKQAGHGICEPAEVFAALMFRSKLAKTAEYRDQIVKLADTVKGQPRSALQSAQMVKLAETMDMIDRTLGIREYGEMLKRPEDVVFSVTFTKVASDRAELCAMTTGNVYSKVQFEKLSRDDVEALFGTDFAKEVSDGLTLNVEKLAEVAHTLPRPDAELFDRLMADASQSPVLQKAASAMRSTTEQLEAMAAAYLPAG